MKNFEIIVETEEQFKKSMLPGPYKSMDWL